MNTNKTVITGSGTLNAGTYGKIVISGSAKITGDISCDDLSVSGACNSAGIIEARNIHVNGSFKSEKALKANAITTNGSLKVEGDIKCDKFYVNGSTKTEATNIYSEYLEINGSLTNEKELNADRIVVNGKIKANEVVGTTIEICKSSINLDFGSFFRFTSRSTWINKAESITCENIYAKHLKCNKICADNITLKSDCRVEYIECNGTLFIGRGCKVGNIQGKCEVVRE